MIKMNYSFKKVYSILLDILPDLQILYLENVTE